MFADAIAVFGGFVVAVTTIGVSPRTYMNGAQGLLLHEGPDLGLLKAVCFGNIIGSWAAIYGFHAEGGAEGVGRATTQAVVASCVLVLIIDYVLANVLFRVIFSPNMIEIRGLKKRLGEQAVLDGVDLDVGTGETVVILGPSGTGKSVLLKHIIGLMQADEGSSWSTARRSSGSTERELNGPRRFGMLFQGAALFDSMTVGENVGAGAARAHAMPRRGDRAARAGAPGVGRARGRRGHEAGVAVGRHAQARRARARDRHGPAVHPVR